MKKKRHSIYATLFCWSLKRTTLRIPTHPTPDSEIQATTRRDCRLAYFEDQAFCLQHLLGCSSDNTWPLPLDLLTLEVDLCPGLLPQLLQHHTSLANDGTNSIFTHKLGDSHLFEHLARTSCCLHELLNKHLLRHCTLLVRAQH